MTRLTIIARALAMLVFAGCFGGASTPRTYYTLQYPMETAAAAYQGATWPFSLRVKRVDINLAYDKSEMVYRSSPFEFQYYWFKLWAAKPQKMIAEIIAGHLTRAGVVSTVTTKILDQLPDYELTGEIIAIEELDADELWFAHLAMRLTLTRFSDGHAIWAYSFDQRKRVYERQPVFVVKAMSALLEEQMRIVTTSIGAKLGEEARRLGVAAVPRPELPPVESTPDTAMPPREEFTEPGATDVQKPPKPEKLPTVKEPKARLKR